MTREPEPWEVEAYESVQADIAAGQHYIGQCYILTCGGDSYDPCKDARDKDDYANQVAERIEKGNSDD